jgi:hypothetical protein
MKYLLCSACFLLATSMAKADPIIVIGTPADTLMGVPAASPAWGDNVENFNSLAPFTTYSAYTSFTTTISSPDGLIVLPDSTQIYPNQLFDNSPNGSANITISSTYPVCAIAVGVADLDPNPPNITIQALGAGGVDLGSPFIVNLLDTESPTDPGNAYYAIEDPTADIWGLQITMPGSGSNIRGLAIDEVEVTPEPPSFVFMASGLLALLLIVSFRRLNEQKRA